ARASQRADALEEARVEARLAVHLGVERGAEERTLLDRDDATIGQGGEHARERPDLLDDGRADEDGVDGRVAERRHLELGLEGLELRAEGVAAHRDVEPAEGLLP